jgi:hypothetical protein
VGGLCKEETGEMSMIRGGRGEGKAWISPWLCFSLFFWDLIPNVTRGEHLATSISIVVSTLYTLPEVYREAGSTPV